MKNKTGETKLLPSDLLVALSDESVTAIYVADFETDELLFMNRTAKKILGVTGEIEAGQKCYEYLMHRDSFCPFCHKSMFQDNKFRENILCFPTNGREYRISSKILWWAKRKLHVHYITDVTDLLNKEKTLRSLTDHIPTGIGIYYVYPDERVEVGYLNDGYYEMMETTREKRLEYSGFASFRAIYPEDLAGIKKEIKNALRENRQIYYEMRIRKDDGSYKWVNIRADIFERTEEKATLYSVYSDIDLLKKAQQEQMERERHYEEEIRLKTTVSSNVKILAIADLTKNEVLEAANKDSKLTAFFHRKDMDRTIEAISNVYIDPYEQAEYREHFQRKKMLQEYDRSITHGSFRHQIKDHDGWYETCYDLVLNPYNDDVEAIFSLCNVTETVQSERVINILMKIDYDSILIIDAVTGKPTVLEASNHTKILLEEQKAAKDNALGVVQYLRKYCSDEDVERVIEETSLPYVRARLEEAPLYTTMYTLKLNGTNRRKRAVYAYLDYTKKMILCARQDVTENYEKLEAALQEAKEASQSRTEFFAHMSHDMRTPLNGILGSVGLAIEAEEHSSQMAEYLHDIQFSGEFLLNLINDILDLSKIENSAMELNAQTYTYFEFIANMTKMIEPLCKNKNITLNMNPLEQDIAICVDILRFQQIFFNIFSNAVKYTPSGGTIDHYTEVSFMDENHIDCKCHIIDNGIGMSEEFQKKLFEPYARERTKPNIQGTGLGLSIANELTHLMGGEITVHSELGKGTEVIIHTVLEVVPFPQTFPENRQPDTLPYDRLKGLHVLLCEDHPLNAKIAKRILEKYEVEVDLSENGEEGVKDFLSSTIGYYDLILMDIRMPVLNGLEAAKIIRKSSRADAASVPILAMTANAYEEDVKKSLEAGMNGHLAKPVKPEAMYAEIIEMCKNRT